MLQLSKMHLKISHIWREISTSFCYAQLEDDFALSGYINNVGMLPFCILLTAVLLDVYITRLMPLVTAMVTTHYFLVLMSAVFRKIKVLFFR